MLRKKKKKNESTKCAAYLSIVDMALCENLCGFVMVRMWLQSWSPSCL